MDVQNEIAIYFILYCIKKHSLLLLLVCAVPVVLLIFAGLTETMSFSVLS